MPRKRLAARLYQRPDTGEWIIRDGPITRRTGCGAGERGAAEKALAAYVEARDAAARPGGPSHPHELTVGAVLALYADHRAETVASPQTLAYSITALATFWGDLTCDAVKASTCRSYELHRAKPRADATGRLRAASASTVRRDLGVLQAALNHAHAEGVLIYPVKVTLSAAAPPRDRWITRSEAARLLRAASPHLRRFILLSLYTGRRHGALLDLTWARVDLDAGVIRFREDGERETNKRRGRARIPRQLLAHLRRWRQSARRGETHVINWRGRPLDSIKTAMEAASHRADLPGVTAHVLKHTAITWAISNGMEVEDAAEFFDTTPDVIRKTYWHHSPKHQQRALAIIERRGLGA